jgi:O-antigen/teichoic acid export membrane protein
MGVVIRQSILTSIISYVGVVIGYINLLYLYPKFLEPEQIGLLRTIQDAALLFTPFAIFGLGQSIIKFFPHFSTQEKRSANFITLILTLALVCYGLFFIAFMAFREFFISFFEKNAPNIIQYTPLILWLTFFLLFITLLEQYSRSLLNIAFPSFLREVGIRLLQGILVSFYFLGWISFEKFLLISVVLWMVLLIVLALYLIRQRQLKLNFDYRSFPRVKLKEILTFSALSFVGTSAMILIGKMDSVMVSGMLGLAANAIYTTAFYMATVIEIPRRAITTTASPLIARAFEKNDLQEVRSIYRKTAINQFIIGALLLIGIWANLPNLFRLMPRGEYYQAGAFVVTIVGCGKLLDMVFGPSSEIIGLSKHYWFNLVVITLLAGIVIVANALLIPALGLEGAAYGTVLALTVYNLSKFIFIYAKFGLQPFSLDTFKVLLIAIGTALLNLALPSLEHPVPDIIYRSFILTLVFGGVIVLTRSSKEVNSVFFTVVNKLKHWSGKP